MLRFRRDFCQRFKDEAAFMHCRVRDRKLRRIYYAVAKEKNIYVDDAGAFVPGALPAHFLLDGEDGGHELLGQLRRFYLDGAVQKPWLVRNLDGCGLVEGRDRDDVASRFQTSDSVPQMISTVA